MGFGRILVMKVGWLGLLAILPLMFACRGQEALIRPRCGARRCVELPLPRIIRRSRDGTEMVLVQGGRVRRGAVSQDERALPDEKPATWVTVEPFYVDRTEVTRRQFAAFVAATGHITDLEKDAGGSAHGEPGASGPRWTGGWTWRAGPPGMAKDDPSSPDLPVAFVSLEDAQVYCHWVGAKLPTEAQFEFLLRSETPLSIYPWGDEPTPPTGWGNYAGEELGDAYPDWALHVIEGYRDEHRRTAPVGSYRRDSNGLYDVSGNVSEWCSDAFAAYGTNPDEYWGGEGPHDGVLRGGNFFQNPETLRTSWRRQADRNLGREFWGFRCVRGAPCRGRQTTP